MKHSIPPFSLTVNPATLKAGLAAASKSLAKFAAKKSIPKKGLRPCRRRRSTSC